MNREIFPAVLYPLIGDVQSQAGNQSVEVVGILSVPIVQSLNLSGQVLEYNLAQNSWIPTLRASIQVNGMTVSDDYFISVNVVKEILVNGS
jgi:hypothetical protein